MGELAANEKADRKAWKARPFQGDVSALITILFICIFVFDVAVPANVAGGVPYVLPVLLGSFYSKRRTIFALAAISSVLTVAGYLLSEPTSQAWVGVVNRGLSLFAIWATALMVIWRKKAEKELIASEQRFRAVVDSSPSAILIKDRDGRYVLANKSWHEWFNPEGQSIAGKTVFDFFPADHARKIGIQDREVVDRGRVVEYEYETPLADGSVISTMMQKFPILDTDGTVVGVAGVNTDISKRIAVERALMDAKAEAERANRAKSEFLATMSHDLRTPLNAIIGFSEAMDMKTFGPVGNPNYEEYVRHILKSGRTLVSLINGLLDLSKIEAGKYRLDEEPFPLAPLLEESIRHLSHQAAEKNVRIERTLAPDLPLLHADDRAVAQIVNNMLSNALKFSHADGVIAVDAGAGEDHAVYIRVTDNGIGMDEKDKAKALQPFERADSKPARKYEGTGLGLYICANLMRLHGGALEIDSELGEGTTVTVRFPPERSIRSSAKPD